MVVTFGKPATLETANVLGFNLPSHSVEELHTSRFDLEGPVKMFLVLEHWGRRWGRTYESEINHAFRRAVSRE